MILSESGKFIFVHIQKNAGTSIEGILRRRFSDVMLWHGRHGHARSGIRDIGRSRWDRYYSFTFVRNPWDRMVSWYSMIQQELKKLPADRQASAKPFASPFWNQVVTNSHDFDSFLHNCTEPVFDGRCLKSYAFNQLDYLLDEAGDLAVNFVGRFENLQADSSTVFDHLGIGPGDLPTFNVSQHGHYSQYYTGTTRDLVAERFQRDIESFGYRFETPG